MTDTTEPTRPMHWIVTTKTGRTYASAPKSITKEQILAYSRTLVRIFEDRTASFSFSIDDTGLERVFIPTHQIEAIGLVHEVLTQLHDYEEAE